MSAFGPPGPSSDYKKTVNVTAVKVTKRRSVRTARQLDGSKSPVRIYS